ncbi:MAG: ribonuclease P protein component [Acidimicrobiia bacterium]
MLVPLRSSGRFAEIYRDGVSRRHGAVTVFQATGTAGSTRVGVVAGKKVGSAVQRNRAKRRLREALRRVEIPDGLDVVVVASPGVLTAPFPTLVDWLGDALEAKPMTMEAR